MVAKCRFCDTPLKHIFADLGMSPLSNSYLKVEELNQPEPFYPLHVYVCEQCSLVQLQEYEAPGHIFRNYAYFSSYSESWLKHARDYAAYMIEQFGVNTSSQVIEIASNDGYLLQYFKEKSIPVMGIEPAGNVAQAAIDAGIPTLVKFFGTKLASELVADNLQADLLIGKNVLAHVPDLHDFVEGLRILLGKEGVVTMEFPHLLRLVEDGQFDTIYHEHFSYFSFLTVERIFARHGLVVFDVEELSTHGGSLRIFAKHTSDDSKAVTSRVRELEKKEHGAGLDQLSTYCGFASKVRQAKRDLLEFLIKAKRDDKAIVGYGAPAKATTLLNYCGIGTDFLDYTVDRSPHKQGLFLPGVHIPIYPPEKINDTRPDYVLILPWNLRDEIMEQMACISEWGGRFVTPVPRVEVLG